MPMHVSISKRSAWTGEENRQRDSHHSMNTDEKVDYTSNSVHFFLFHFPFSMIIFSVSFSIEIVMHNFPITHGHQHHTNKRDKLKATIALTHSRRSCCFFMQIFLGENLLYRSEVSVCLMLQSISVRAYFLCCAFSMIFARFVIILLNGTQYFFRPQVQTKLLMKHKKSDIESSVRFNAQTHRHIDWYIYIH